MLNCIIKVRGNMMRVKGIYILYRHTGIIITAIMIILPCMEGTAQSTENELETRADLKISYKPVKKFRLSLSPEIRFTDGFSVDKYLVQAGTKYKVTDFLSLGAGYRFIGNKRKTKDTEYLHRYEFDVTIRKNLQRFEPSFRIRYTNFSDDDLEERYLRYKMEIDYDIPKCPFTPYISAQAFHGFSIGRIEKMRYAVGGRYKIMNNNYIGLFYKLDYYYLEFKNKHILGVSYRIKL
jgi:hypothetical protein